MRNNDTNTGGFSLLEIMITVAIVGIMASSVVIGFGSFEQTVRVRETAGVISDTIKNLELDTIRRDYTKQTVHFEKDYLVVESENENQTLSLKWIKPSTCMQGEETLEIDNSGSGTPTYLAQRDAEGNNLNISSIPAFVKEPVCVPFMLAEQTEWAYQVFKDTEVSQTIRFLHFNLRREDNPSTWVEITAGSNFSLEILAPYASKTFFDNGNPTIGTVDLTLETVESDGASETLTLNP